MSQKSMRYKAINPRYDMSIREAKIIMARLVALALPVAGLFVTPQGGGQISGAHQVDTIPAEDLIKDGVPETEPVFTVIRFYGSNDEHPAALLWEIMQGGDLMAYARLYSQVHPGDSGAGYMRALLNMPTVKAAALDTVAAAALPLDRESKG